MPKKYEQDIDSLCTAMQASRLVLRGARERRNRAVSFYAGPNWGEINSQISYVNLLSLYVSIVSRKLIANNPRVLLSTFSRQDKPAVTAMNTWVNKEIEGMRLANTLQRIVLDALFSVGICKVSLATPSDSALGAWNVQAGQPYAQRVDLDDFAYDHHARDFSEASFTAHRYRVPLSTVRDDSKNYNKSRKSLTASTDERFNTQGDERINVLGRGYWGNDEEIEEMVDLWEVYCPRHKCVYTLSEDNLTGVTAPGHGGKPEPLREQDWIGPDSGPYKFLGYLTVPGNAMPKGPIMDLIDLHVSANRIMRKLIWSAENMKDVLILPKGADGDIERIRNSMHGDIVGMDRPQEAKNVVMNGPNQMLWQFFGELKGLFSWLAGNLDIMGGLSPQAKTATQDTMLDRNSTEGIGHMQDKTVSFTSDIIESLCWYYWHDPQKVMKTQYTLPGMPEMSIQRKVAPWNSPDPRALKRQGNWEDLDVKVDPYSLSHTTPQQRASDLMKIATQLYMPGAELFKSQGIMLDLNMFIAKMGEYTDNPDWVDLLGAAPPPQEEPGPSSGDIGPRPAQTERTYNRTNTPGRTREGNDMMLQNALAGMDGGGASNGQVQPQGA